MKAGEDADQDVLGRVLGILRMPEVTQGQRVHVLANGTYHRFQCGSFTGPGTCHRVFEALRHAGWGDAQACSLLEDGFQATKLFCQGARLGVERTFELRQRHRWWR